MYAESKHKADKCWAKADSFQFQADCLLQGTFFFFHYLPSLTTGVQWGQLQSRPSAPAVCTINELDAKQAHGKAAWKPLTLVVLLIKDISPFPLWRTNCIHGVAWAHQIFHVAAISSFWPKSGGERVRCLAWGCRTSCSSQQSPGSTSKH